MRGRFAPHLILLSLIAIWSASFVVSKVALHALSPSGLVAARFWLAVVCMLPFLGRDALADLRRSLRPGLAAGVALGMGYLLQMEGMTETSASMGGLLAGLIVPLVAVGGFLFFGARLGGVAIVGLLLAIAGMLAICWPGEKQPDERQDTLLGILLQVGASASYAGHVLMLSRFGRTQPVAALAFWQLLFVAVIGVGLAVSHHGVTADGAGVGALVWTGELAWALLYLGVLATAVGIGVQSKVQHLVPPEHVPLLFAMQPLFAAVCGATLQGDRLGGMQFLGGGLIVLGVVVTSFDRPPKAG
ncbi:MAG: DMT family transporter [Planctomycetes bacterium]|nr:DMT family transporter [Planctomycetota bacterium]